MLSASPQLSQEMSTKVGDIGNGAAILDDKPYPTTTSQPIVTQAVEPPSGASVNPGVSSTTFIAELDSTPIGSKKDPLPPSSPSSKTPISDITVMVVGDGNYEDYEMLAGEKPAAAHLIEVLSHESLYVARNMHNSDAAG